MTWYPTRDYLQYLKGLVSWLVVQHGAFLPVQRQRLGGARPAVRPRRHGVLVRRPGVFSPFKARGHRAAAAPSLARL